MLLLEQLKYFYKLQPGEVSVGDQFVFFENQERQEAVEKRKARQADEELRQEDLEDRNLGFRDPNIEILPRRSENRIEIDVYQPVTKKSEQAKPSPKGILKSSMGGKTMKRGGGASVNPGAMIRREEAELLESGIGNQYDRGSDYKRFLVGDWELQHEGIDFIFDRTLYEFPVFALNQDFLKSIVRILFADIDALINMARHKNDLLHKVLPLSAMQSPLVKALLQKDKVLVPEVGSVMDSFSFSKKPKVARKRPATARAYKPIAQRRG